MRPARGGPTGAETPLVSAGAGWYDLRPVAAEVDGALPAGRDRVRAALAAGELPPVPVPVPEPEPDRLEIDGRGRQRHRARRRRGMAGLRLRPRG